MTKTTTLTMRINPEIKEMLINAAKSEHRSLTNMIEALIIEYWEAKKEIK